MKAWEEWEHELAEALGGVRVRGSGSQWYAKMDVGDRKFLWSAKWTNKKSFRLTKEIIDEVVDAIEAPGGVGGNRLPGVGVRVNGANEDLVVLRLSDFVSLMKDGGTYVQPSKSEMKRSTARMPILLRDEE